MHEVSSQKRNISQFSVYQHTMSDIWDDGSKYKNFIEQEWNVKKSFSFDDYRSFSDLKIFKMQNIQRFVDMEKNFKLPVNFGFCRDFCVNNKRYRPLQRHLCQENCFWNPQICFLEQAHSGNLVDLMKKSFHDTFNPAFASQFNRVYAGKIDWSLNGGVGNFPSFGLKKLIEDKVECYKGIVEQLSGPAMTYNMKVIYPCNRSACNHGCDCGFCDLSSLCPPDTHK